MDDLDLIRRLRQGDRTAFERLVRRWDGRVLNFAYRLSGDRQEVVTSVIGTLHRYGRKLEDVPGHEDIVVAMRFVRSDNFSDLRVLGLLGVPELDLDFALHSQLLSQHAEIKPVTVVLRVSKRDLLIHAGENGRKELESSVTVTRY